MEKFNINNEELLSIVSSIMDITKLIKSTYKRLENLETLGMKDSKYYTESIEYLQKLLIREDKLYLMLNKYVKNIPDIINYLFSNAQNNIIDILRYLKNSDENEIFISRIGYRLEEIQRNQKINYLKKYYFDDSEDYETDFDFEDIQDECIDLNEEDYLEEFDDVKHNFKIDYNVIKNELLSNKIDSETEKDIINTILSILDEYIENIDYSNIQKELISFKYNLIFYFKPLEAELLKNNFNVSDKLYWGANIFSSIMGKAGNHIVTISRRNTVKSIMVDQISNIIDLYCRDFSNKDYANSILIQILLRTCALFSSKEDIAYFKKILKNELEDFDEFEIKNDELIEIIKDAFNKNNIDKKIPEILSFNK